MLTHTVQNDDEPDRVYQGLTRMVKPPEKPQFVVIAWFDGEPELWVLENNDAAIAELRRYYYEEWQRSSIEMTIMFASEHRQ